MPLHKGPQKPDERPLSVNPFYGEADPVGGMIAAPPKHRLPGRPDAPVDGVPARARRADAGRQLPAEPGHLRHHLDGAAGRAC